MLTPYDAEECDASVEYLPGNRCETTALFSENVVYPRAFLLLEMSVLPDTHIHPKKGQMFAAENAFAHNSPLVSSRKYIRTSRKNRTPRLRGGEEEEIRAEGNSPSFFASSLQLKRAQHFTGGLQRDRQAFPPSSARAV